MANMRGCVVSLVTPFNKDLSLDERGWQKLLNWQLSFPSDNFLIGSDVGEGPYLAKEELFYLLSIAQQTAPLKKWIVQVDPEQALNDIGLVQELKRLRPALLVLSFDDLIRKGMGLQEFLVLSKSKIPLVLEIETESYFDELLPYLAYPSVLYVKDNTMNHSLTKQILNKTGAKVLLGKELALSQFSQRGEVGVFTALACLLPAEMDKYIRKHFEEDIQAKLDLQKKIHPLLKLSRSKTLFSLLKQSLKGRGICEEHIRGKRDPQETHLYALLQNHLKLIG